MSVESSGCTCGLAVPGLSASPITSETASRSYITRYTGSRGSVRLYRAYLICTPVVRIDPGNQKVQISHLMTHTITVYLADCLEN